MSDQSAKFVVVGGGVAGALVADRLGHANHSVILLEAGSRVNRDDAASALATSPTRSLSSPYKDTHFDFAPFRDRLDPFKSTYMRRLGGSTWHWQGSTPRMIPSDFRMRSLYGVGHDWPIGYDDLEEWYCQAETELGVSGDHDVWQDVLGAHRGRPFPMTAIWPSDGDRRMAVLVHGISVEGQALRVRPVPQARNSRPYQGRPPCAGNSTCIPLCPIGAKYDASVHVDRAVGHPKVKVRDLTYAIKLEFSGGKVTGVVAKDGRTGETHTFRGDYVVVCAHAIETVRLLVASNYQDESGQLGRNLMDHPTGQMVALAPWPVWPFRGPPVTSGIDDLRDGPFRHKQAAWKLSLGNDGWGRFRTPDQIVGGWIDQVGFGQALRQKIEDEGSRLYRISWATEQLPSADNRLIPTGKVDTGYGPELAIEYGVSSYTTDAFPVIRHSIARIFDRAGMTGVMADADPLRFGGSGHIMGTYRMAKTVADGVVDPWGRAFSAENLYLLGSGTFPTVGTANPTLTVAALALRTAAYLDGRHAR
ncbi:MAG TPA: GMC family oxidoreductase [Polyangia bacterium]